MAVPVVNGVASVQLATAQQRPDIRYRLVLVPPRKHPGAMRTPCNKPNRWALRKARGERAI